MSGRRDPPPPPAPLSQDNPDWLCPNTNSSQVQKRQLRTPLPPAMTSLLSPAPARDILCPGDVTRPWSMAGYS